jgi:hypothetical protein
MPDREIEILADAGDVARRAADIVSETARAAVAARRARRPARSSCW